MNRLRVPRPYYPIEAQPVDATLPRQLQGFWPTIPFRIPERRAFALFVIAFEAICPADRSIQSPRRFSVAARRHGIQHRFMELNSGGSRPSSTGDATGRDHPFNRLIPLNCGSWHALCQASWVRRGVIA